LGARLLGANGLAAQRAVHASQYWLLQKMARKPLGLSQGINGQPFYNSFTYKQFGNGATLENGLFVLSTIGRLAVRWSPPITGRPKTVTISREADGWYVCFSCEAVPPLCWMSTDCRT